MLGLMIAVIIFNSIAFLTNKNLTKNQIVHVWTLTISFQLLADLLLDGKYKGYWYFAKDMVDWASLPALTILIPPVCMMFLNWYPFHTTLLKRFLYIVCWSILITIYESITLLPEPWGFFHYGWWNLGYSALCYPVLLLILLKSYEWIRKMEKIN